jgi:hypothetical protein
MANPTITLLTRRVDAGRSAGCIRILHKVIAGLQDASFLKTFPEQQFPDRMVHAVVSKHITPAMFVMNREKHGDQYFA